MSFLNNSVNYSLVNLLKNDILKPLMVMYNNFFVNNCEEQLSNRYDYLIPNNNKKYYLLITKKKNLEREENRRFEILYFFQHDLQRDSYGEFYMEIDKTFEDEILFEGYLYKNCNQYNYLITDILIKNKSVIDVSYGLRFVLINEIIKRIGVCKLTKLNEHMSINVHMIIDFENKNNVKIFKNNFIFKDQIDSVEHVSNFIKVTYKERDVEQCDKIIERTDKIDVYNVYDKTTNDNEGILYVKGIKESTSLLELFKNKCDNDFVKIISENKILIKCEWNKRFYKWKPILI